MIIALVALVVGGGGFLAILADKGGEVDTEGKGVYGRNCFLSSACCPLLALTLL